MVSWQGVAARRKNTRHLVWAAHFEHRVSLLSEVSRLDHPRHFGVSDTDPRPRVCVRHTRAVSNTYRVCPTRTC